MPKFLSIILTISFLNSFSQEKKIDRYLAFGPTISSYRGDLNQHYTKGDGSLNIMLIPERDKLIQSSLELNMGRVVGQKSGYHSEKLPQYEPNTFFQTTYASFSFNIRAYLYRKNNLKIYIGQGIGAIRYTPKDELYNSLLEQDSTRIFDRGQPETYSNLSMILPRTIGLSYKLKNNYRLALDINQQAPRTDYIDNIGSLGVSKKKDKILLVRFSVMIPILYKKEKEDLVEPAS